MAKTDCVLQILIHTIKEAGYYNISRFEEIRVKDYPFLASNEFIEAMIRIHKELLHKIDLLEQDIFTTKNEFEEQIIEVQRFGQMFSELHSLLQILEMGGRQYIPGFIARLIGDILNILNPKAKFIFLPDYEYNYAYLELIGPVKVALQDAVSDIEKSLAFTEKLAIFWFPLAHKDNMLLNSLLGHELGHFVNEERQIVDKLITKILIPPAEIEEIAKEWLRTKLRGEKKEIKLDDYFGIETAKAQVKRDVVLKISEQLKELVSDAVAFYIFGPVFLISQNNYLTSLSNLEHKPKGYPSARMRLEFLVDLFDSIGYTAMLESQKKSENPTHREVSKKFEEVVEAIKGIMKKQTIVNEDKEEALVYESIYRLKKDLWIEVHNAIKGQEFTAEIFADEVFKLTDVIDSFVPPAEIELECPANPLSILNAGMLYELTSMERMHEELNDKTIEERLSTRHKLHKLIMKAGELSQIQKMLQATEENATE
jgi:hypothetical protein